MTFLTNWFETLRNKIIPMVTIYKTVTDYQKKAGKFLLNKYPQIAEIHHLMDLYFTCVMARFNKVEVDNRGNDGYKLSLLLSFMRTNYTVSKLILRSEVIDAYTLLRKQLELIARFTELDKSSKESLKKQNNTPNIKETPGMGPYYGFMSNIAHSTAYKELGDVFAYEKQIDGKLGLSMQPQFTEYTIDTFCLQCELFFRFSNLILDFQSQLLDDYESEQDLRIFLLIMEKGKETQLDYFMSFTSNEG